MEVQHQCSKFTKPVSQKKKFTKPLLDLKNVRLAPHPSHKQMEIAVKFPLHHQYLGSTVPKCTILCTAGSIHLPLSLSTFFCLLHHSDSFDLNFLVLPLDIMQYACVEGQERRGIIFRFMLSRLFQVIVYMDNKGIKIIHPFFFFMRSMIYIPIFIFIYLVGINRIVGKVRRLKNNFY